jgi:hypothetical protein
MLNRQIPGVIYGCLFGIFVTVVVFGATYKYLPSPLEMFDGDECRQSAIQTQKKATTGKDGTRNNAPLLQNSQPGNLKNESESQNHEYECLIAEYTGRLAAFTRWLVIATLLLALFGFWQVMVSRDTARRQLRAYVLISSAKVHDFGIDLSPRVEIIIKNSGQTPAYDLLSWNGMVCEKFPLNIELVDPPQDMKRSSSILGGGDTTSHLTQAGRPLTKIHTDMIIAGKAAIYVFVAIKYKDIFKKIEWSTRYRMMYGGGGGATPDGALTFCEEGNDAT